MVIQSATLYFGSCNIVRIIDLCCT